MDAGRRVLHARRRDGRHPRDAPRGAGRSDVPRRHQARHAPRADRDERRDPSRGSVIPGEVVGPDEPIELNAGARRPRCAVVNAGDRPVQVGSHYHFAEANPALAVRPRRGARAPARHPRRHVGALRARHRAPTSTSSRSAATASSPASAARSPVRSTRHDGIDELVDARYRALYGPTAGDRIRLADTDLLIEVERRPRAPAATRSCSAAARSSASRWASRPATRADGTPDLVITGARDPRPLGRRQGRHRRPRRPHRRHRQGRQPRHDGRRRSRRS